MTFIQTVLRRFRGKGRGVPPGRAFISYSYQDAAALELLEARLPGKVEPRPFPPISVSPQEMVSNKLLSAIRDCRSLIYIDTPVSRRSRWVTLERDYARRTGMPIYAFEPATGRLIPDVDPPLDLPVFPSYTREDKHLVDELITFMRKERYFDVFIETLDLQPGGNFQEILSSAMVERLARGGYAVIFWSARAARSNWVREEVEWSLSKYPSQILVALLEDVEPPGLLAQRHFLRLHGEIGGLDYNRVDDLIVWLYWLIEEGQGAATHAG